jgi:methyl-accepting chemotaxis protein
MSIRLKLFLSFLGLSLLPLAMVGWLMFNSMQNSFITEVRERLTRLSDVQRDRLQANFDAGTLNQDLVNRLTSVFSEFNGQTGETLIMAPDGHGGVTLQTPRRFEQIQPSAAVAAMGLSKKDMFADDVVDAYGKHVLVAESYLPAKDWAVVVKLDREEVLAPLQGVFSIMLLVMIFFVLGIIFLSLLVTESILNPIRQLTDTTQAISMGDLRAVVDAETLAAKDEVGDLARAFDRTLVSLKLAMLAPAVEVKPVDRGPKPDQTVKPSV